MTENKFSFEWHSILRDLLRNFWVIICAAVIGILGSYVVKHVVYHPEYTSSATVIVNSAAGKSNAVATLSQSSEIASIYAEVFIQPTMEKKVCEYLGRDSFDGVIKAHVNAGTNIMELSVTAANPEEAYRELCAILKVYPEITKNLYSNGVVSVLRPAGVPKSPSNSMTSASILKIALVSMILAVMMIAVLSVLRDTVKNEMSFSDKIDARLLGVIPHEKKPNEFLRSLLRRDKKGILFPEGAYTSLRFTENINKIASRVEYMHKTQGDKVFAITSVAENEGKSTVASNLAVSLAIKGNKVVLVDFDGKKPALYKIFEQSYDKNHEFGYMLSGEIKKEDFRFRRYRKTSLFLALNTKVHSDYRRWFETGVAKKVTDALRASADFVIIDTAPVSVDGVVTEITKLCDSVILTVRTDGVYAPIINDAILTLNNTGAKFAGCILNDVYDEFTLFNQMGTNEAGYTNYGRYSRYQKYGRYGRYSKYSHGYNKYSSHMDLEDVSVEEDEMPKVYTENTVGGGV